MTATEGPATRRALLVPRPAVRGGRSGLALAGPALAGIILIGAGLRFWALGRQGLWYDEAITAWLVRGTPGQVLATVPRTESTPPLYYLVAWAWVHVFGDTAVGLRSLSAIAGTLAIPATYAAGRELVGHRAGLAAALLVAVNPVLVWYAQEGRAYALLVLLTAASIWLAARARRAPTAPRLSAWAACAVAALWTHYFAVFVVAGEAVLLLRGTRGPVTARRRAVVVVGFAGLLLLPLAAAQRHHADLFGRIRLPVRAAQVPAELLAGFTPPAGPAAVGALALVAGGAIALVVRRGSPAERRGATVAAGLLAAAVGVPLLLAIAGADFLDTRNVIGAAVPLALTLGIGLGARRAGAAGAMLTAAAVVVSVALVFTMASDASAQRPAWQRVAAAIRGPTPRAIVLIHGRSWVRPLSYYLPHTWIAPRRGARVRRLDILRRVSPIYCRAVWWGATCDTRAHGIPPGLPGPGFRRVSSAHVDGYAITRYVASRPVLVHQFRNSRRLRLLLTPTATPKP